MPDRDLKAPVASFAPISEPTNIAGTTATYAYHVKVAVADKAPLAISQGIIAAPIVNRPEQTQSPISE